MKNLMTNNRVPPHCRPCMPVLPAPRAGTTLTEVLIALAIMAIGIVSVATMFPLSVIRAVQASQLTNATILRFNAEAMLDTDRKVIFDPNRNSNLKEHYNTFYVVDPVGYYTARADVNPNDDLSGSSAADLFGYDNNNAIRSFTKRYGGVALPLAKWDTDGSGKVTAREAIAAGNFLTTLPDTWILESEDFATTTAADLMSVTFGKADLTNIVDPGDPTKLRTDQLIRAHLFDNSGRQSQVRTLTGANKNTRTISWADALPGRLGTTVGQVKIEIQDRRFTWLLTVRRQPRGAANMDVVVFFNRTYLPKEEQIILNSDKLVFTQASDIATVQYPSNSPPWVAKGGWCFDPTNAHWYRIQNFSTVDNGGTTTATLRLSTRSSGNGRGVMFFRGVIDVYPIGTLNPS